MGDKINARKQMITGVPVIPGSDAEVYTAEGSPEIAERGCRPVMLSTCRRWKELKVETRRSG